MFLDEASTGMNMVIYIHCNVGKTCYFDRIKMYWKCAISKMKIWSILKLRVMFNIRGNEDC